MLFGQYHKMDDIPTVSPTTREMLFPRTSPYYIPSYRRNRTYNEVMDMEEGKTDALKEEITAFCNARIKDYTEWFNGNFIFYLKDKEHWECHSILSDIANSIADEDTRQIMAVRVRRVKARAVREYHAYRLFDDNYDTMREDIIGKVTKPLNDYLEYIGKMGSEATPNEQNTLSIIYRELYAVSDYEIPYDETNRNVCCGILPELTLIVSLLENRELPFSEVRENIIDGILYTTDIKGNKQRKKRYTADSDKNGEFVYDSVTGQRIRANNGESILKMTLDLNERNRRKENLVWRLGETA